jgi:DNA modification methylase
MNELVQIINGDALESLKALPSSSVQTCVTSPPFWGLRNAPAEYVERMVSVFREVKRVLKAEGQLWLNCGDTYVTGAGRVGTNLVADAKGRTGAEAMRVNKATWHPLVP